MNSEIVKECLGVIEKAVTFKYPAIGWYFSSEEIADSVCYKKDRWVCMFMYLKMVIKKGKRIRFCEDHGHACTGPAEYFGFKELTGEDGKFIADTERFKKSRELASYYYHESLKCIHPPKERFLYMEPITAIDKNRDIEVVNLFPDLAGLARLSGLSYYDRETNSDNVLMPFASACESVFTIPYHQGFEAKPKSVVGMMDVLARKFIPKDLISFSVPANRFVEMTNNIPGSFLDENFKAPISF